MSSVKVYIPKNIHPRQIEFGEGVERSQIGALYFVPGTVKYMTEGEYEWIGKHDKKFFRLLKILPNETELASKPKNVPKNDLKKRKVNDTLNRKPEAVVSKTQSPTKVEN